MTRVSVANNLDLRRLGTDYGGWWIPLRLIHPNSIIYSVGIGEDASFDVSLIEASGCVVHAFDPTPRAIKFLERLGNDAIVLHPYGIWNTTGTIPMFFPKNTEHVSLSVVDRFQTGVSLDIPVQTLQQTLTECGHDHIDLLKMDIEGAEVEVIQDLISLPSLPRVLAVEMERVESPLKTLKRIHYLKSIGYTPIAVERNNLTFLLKDLVELTR